VRLWKPECALISRPHGQVGVRVISAGAHAFMAALAEGRTIGLAIAHGMANVPDFDLADCFNTLIAAETAVGMALSELSPNTHM
jgi:hypothetical protein